MKHMKLMILIWLALLSMVQHSLCQQSLSDARRKMLMGGDALMAEATSAVQAKSLEELKDIVNDEGESPSLRSASAKLMLQRAKTLEQKVAAFPALGIDLPLGVSDFESDWRKSYPVAAEASLHPDLMPQLIQRTLDGTLPESVVGFILLRYQTENHSPAEQLSILLKTNLTPEQRQRGERMIAILKGEEPKEPPSKGAAEKPASTMPAVVVLPVAKKAEPKAAASMALAPNEEPVSSPPRSIIIVSIIAAASLLWLLVKKRK